MRSRSAAILFLMKILVLGTLLCGCDYARMRDDEAVNLYEMELPGMPDGIVPLVGENEPVFTQSPEQIKNPLDGSPSMIQAGGRAYVYFCIHCHGPGGEGYGTVGQSFAPLPTNLKSAYVQEQADGALFHRIGKGYKRHPPLAYTMSINDLWAVVLYIRSLN